MKSANGATAPASKTPQQTAIELAVATLSGDVRDAVLSEFKQLPKPWQQMNEDEQDHTIHRARDIADDLVRRAVSIVAANGLESMPITVGKFTVDGSELKGTFTAYASDEHVVSVRHLSEKRAMFVLADPVDYAGERKAAEPDVVGDLSIPKTGPGAPSDPKAEKEIGRGKGRNAKPPGSDNDTSTAEQPFRG